ncbi:TetR/AcrR family transcriptional regulator [Streptomyces polyrhachis]|uniref:TetR/AcrR family transcriptional regulator n=1 Tax=Streptomyces polyrhachis TaxID=1282885 RepID=A0ABW2GIB8_9ACTN
MNLRQQAAARTRAALIDTGLRLTERVGLAALSVNALVAELGVSKGVFFHHFGTRAGYLLALHREFHDRLETALEAAIADHRPGPDRLLAGSYAYLDACLRDRGVKALLLEARAEPAIVEEVQSRNARSATLAEADFRAMGWRHPADGARLWVAMVAETALLELTTGPRPQTRDALRQFTIRPAH